MSRSHAAMEAIARYRLEYPDLTGEEEDRIARAADRGEFLVLRCASLSFYDAPSAPLPPDAWVMVPLDDPKLSCADSLIPDEMVIAGIDAYEAAQAKLANDGTLNADGLDAAMIVLEIYRAMVAARPKLPGACLNEEVSLPSRPAPATRAEPVRAG